MTRKERSETFADPVPEPPRDAYAAVKRPPYVMAPATPAARVTRPAWGVESPESAQVKRPAFQGSPAAADDREEKIRKAISKARRAVE